MNAEFSIPPDAKARQQMLDQKKAAEAPAAESELKPATPRPKSASAAPPPVKVPRGEAEPVR